MMNDVNFFYLNVAQLVHYGTKPNYHYIISQEKCIKMGSE